MSDSISVTSDVSEASSMSSTFSHIIPFRMAPLNVSLSTKLTYPQYPRAAFPKEKQFLATGVFVDNDARLFLHVLVDGENIALVVFKLLDIDSLNDCFGFIFIWTELNPHPGTKISETAFIFIFNRDIDPTPHNIEVTTLQHWYREREWKNVILLFSIADWKKKIYICDILCLY